MLAHLLWWGLAWNSHGYSAESLNTDFMSVRSTVHDASVGEDPEDLCVFCHTPVTSADDSIVPKWQATFSDPFVQLDDGFNSAGENATAGAVSIMCLSCHDADAAQYGGGNSGISSMENQHPVGIPYVGIIEGSAGGNLDYGVARKGRYNDGDVWWVETGTPGFQADDIVLFPRVLDDSRVLPFVECSSCHDPHSSNPKFIRLEESERLCQACHPNWF